MSSIDWTETPLTPFITADCCRHCRGRNTSSHQPARRAVRSAAVSCRAGVLTYYVTLRTAAHTGHDVTDIVYATATECESTTSRNRTVLTVSRRAIELDRSRCRRAGETPQQTARDDVRLRRRRLKSKVNFASWSETCSLARAGEQVSERFVGVCDKLATFSR